MCSCRCQTPNCQHTGDEVQGLSIKKNHHDAIKRVFLQLLLTLYGSCRLASSTGRTHSCGTPSALAGGHSRCRTFCSLLQDLTGRVQHEHRETSFQQSRLSTNNNSPNASAWFLPLEHQLIYSVRTACICHAILPWSVVLCVQSGAELSEVTLTREVPKPPGAPANPQRRGLRRNVAV